MPMFPDTSGPRLFALPPGADFARRVVAGLERRLTGQAPEAMAHVSLFVNTRRMQRRIRDVFDQGPPRLLPRVRLITDLAMDPVAADLPPPVAPLRRRLELSQLVSQLLDAAPDLAPRAALYDLSDSLAALMDEMQGEGIDPAVIANLDVTDLSGHWARSLRFLQIVERYFGDTSEAPDHEARQRRVIERLVATWVAAPPQHPVIVAGSTGSRGATALLLAAVARLPQGAVILPGFDFDQPDSVWAALDDAMTSEDHPQYRFRRLMDQLGLARSDVAPWDAVSPPSAARNRLISLSLRPAPVTDQWRAEGPLLTDLAEATQDMTLVEASSPRAEAEAIALRLRQAVEEGITAALITPDRMLTRQVAAALDRWRIVPDDSAGTPLPLSPPGRFLRQVAALFGQPLTGGALLALLKHPLTHTGGTDRGPHLRRTRELELHLRRNGPAFPDGKTLHDWAARTGKDDAGRAAWAAWLAALLDGLDDVGDRPLADHLRAHRAVAEDLAAGVQITGSGTLWDEAAGRMARTACDTLARHAEVGGILSPRDYGAVFAGVLNTAEVRDRDKGHPQVLIWGTLEARVQGADLVILGGMNDGTWPEAPRPDPWLNRSMRAKAGLLLPERRIGLSAHDYQQAVAGAQVWITRAVRSGEAQTVPSRWINRLTNLLEGLPEQGGPEALSAMRARGADWLARAAAVSAPTGTTPLAHRPSPRPPVAARPVSLPVTRIKTLIRDPYAIYAERVLRLRKLDPLTPSADAPLRGIVVHTVLEQFIRNGTAPDAPEARATLLRIADQVLEQECPWPMVHRMWLARIERVADWFLATETARQSRATPEAFEIKGAVALTAADFTLTAKADRIDRAPDGSVLIYDYKTGTPPSPKEQRHFDKQLLLEAAMAARGGFADIGPARVTDATYIGLGNTPKEVHAPLADSPPDAVWSEFETLIARWREPSRGYSARMAVKRTDFAGDYDHLARFGEWDLSSDVLPEDLT